ncbi:MAG: heavy-metal-associated domain-containing protein [Kiritimatiellae bacterium]|nr:heavy-metal-associated domain-containing protein [Kiritimatiellia bacterium]
MKRVLTRIVVLAAMVFVVASCRKDDVRTVVIRVPGMHNEACVQVIRRALAPAQYGVKMDSIKVDLENRRITLAYDSMKLSLKNIEFMIVKAGFAANEVPADPKAAAALPEACR